MTDTAAAQARAVDTAALVSAVPPERASILTEAIHIIAAGGTITLGSIPDELTTTNAADMLDISRLTLTKLIQSKEKPAHNVGSPTRPKTGDVLAYRERMHEQQRAAFRELRAFEDDEARTTDRWSPPLAVGRDLYPEAENHCTPSKLATTTQQSRRHFENR